MSMTRDQVMKAIADGADPSRLGALAHRIKDYVQATGQHWVKTPRYDWHKATPRELRLIREGKVPSHPRRAFKPEPPLWVVQDKDRSVPIGRKKRKSRKSWKSRRNPAQMQLKL